MLKEPDQFHYHHLMPLPDGRYQVKSPQGVQWVSDSLEMARAQVLEFMAYGDHRLPQP